MFFIASTLLGILEVTKKFQSLPAAKCYYYFASGNIVEMHQLYWYLFLSIKLYLLCSFAVCWQIRIRFSTKFGVPNVWHRLWNWVLTIQIIINLYCKPTSKATTNQNNSHNKLTSCQKLVTPAMHSDRINEPCVPKVKIEQNAHWYMQLRIELQWAHTLRIKVGVSILHGAAAPPHENARRQVDSAVNHGRYHRQRSR